MTRTYLFAPFAIAIAAGAATTGACSKQEPVADNAAIANDVLSNDLIANDIAPGNAMPAAPSSFSFTGPAGQPLGTVAVSTDPAGLMMKIVATGLPSGIHGIHLHETGLCDGPKFESAGGHWNPGHKQHGRDNPAGAHAGDLANLTAGADGTASATIPIAGATLAAGPASLADADGTALVIHAKADDYRTDPSGNSGDRIACAVVAAAK